MGPRTVHWGTQERTCWELNINSSIAEIWWLDDRGILSGPAALWGFSLDRGIEGPRSMRYRGANCCKHNVHSQMNPQIPGF